MPGRVSIKIKGQFDSLAEEKLICLVANLVTGSEGKSPTIYRQDSGFNWSLDKSNDFKARLTRDVSQTKSEWSTLTIFWRYGGGGNRHRMETICQHVAYVLDGVCYE